MSALGQKQTCAAQKVMSALCQLLPSVTRSRLEQPSRSCPVDPGSSGRRIACPTFIPLPQKNIVT